MSATILQFKRPGVPSRAAAGIALTGIALTLQARRGSVTLTADELELALTPADARAIARDLLELADVADGAT